jgi:hypothetical protein
MNTTLKAGLRTVALTALLTPALVLVPSTAQANPVTCIGTTNQTQRTYSASCTNGTGEFRARARCNLVGGSTYVIRYGEWTPIGTTRSTVQCLSNESPSHGSSDIRV